MRSMSIAQTRIPNSTLRLRKPAMNPAISTYVLALACAAILATGCGGSSESADPTAAPPADETPIAAEGFESGEPAIGEGEEAEGENDAEAEGDGDADGDAEAEGDGEGEGEGS